MIKKFYLLLFTILFLSISPLLSIDVNYLLGVKGAFALDLNATSDYGTWPGFTGAGGLSGEVILLKRLGIEAFAYFSYDRISLPAKYFVDGLYIKYFNIKYGANIKYWIKEMFFAGIGAGLQYTFYGKYGTGNNEFKLDDNSKGNDIFIQILGGAAIPLINDKIRLPIQIDFTWYPTVSGSAWLQLGANVGILIKL